MSNPVTPTAARTRWRRRDQARAAQRHAEEILQLHREGWTPRLIGASFDISSSAVKALLEEAQGAPLAPPAHSVIEDIAFGRTRFRVVTRSGRMVGPPHDDRTTAEVTARRLNRPPPERRPCICCGRMMDTDGGALWRCAECKRPTRAGTGGGPTHRPDPRRISA